jgi:membrane protease YdiL (CAAX protease family)
MVGVMIGGTIPAATVLFGSFGGWLIVTDPGFSVTVPSLRKIALAVIVTDSIAVVEEIVFRGYILTNAIEGFDHRWLSQPVTIVAARRLSSLLFGILHPTPSLHQGLHFLSAGLLLGLAFLLTGQLGLSIGIHAGFNFVSVYVFPTTLDPAVAIIPVTVDGPVWVVGQSGAIQTGLHLPAALTIVGYVWWRSGRIGISPKIQSLLTDRLDHA